MKAAIILISLAMLIAAVYVTAECDPDAEGIPDCASLLGDAAGTPYRNNWDPTHYFECDGSTVVREACGLGTGYVESSKTCVNWTVWEWEPVC
ncbi:uncharacterized protein LOC132798307 [Drosophila nasuta]|uniref:uncharacterized protein LOC132798307 n=1 Tax=Drosophila nasuta TaxID=42062 RepID=UPI00295E603B|nr:uncharacterized protein LOC132798307 [Drosophila nasuta]